MNNSNIQGGIQSNGNEQIMNLMNSLHYIKKRSSEDLKVNKQDAIIKIVALFKDIQQLQAKEIEKFEKLATQGRLVTVSDNREITVSEEYAELRQHNIQNIVIVNRQGEEQALDHDVVIHVRTGEESLMLLLGLLDVLLLMKQQKEEKLSNNDIKEHDDTVESAHRPQKPEVVEQPVLSNIESEKVIVDTDKKVEEKKEDLKKEKHNKILEKDIKKDLIDDYYVNRSEQKNINK
ncbi:MAG: hypothetical protein Q8K60_04405 [Parachlamydiaceae bacterium]|nr:hypothetical protein [Parachlamydiaceae bacterium]